jgi:hypothetical protein
MSKDDTSLIAQAYYVYKQGGREAFLVWYGDLSDEGKIACRSALDDLMADIIEAFRPAATAFQEFADILSSLFKEQA